VADASFEKEVAFDCLSFFVFFFFVNTTAGFPPKFPRAEMSSLVLHVVQMAPSGGVQKTIWGPAKRRPWASVLKSMHKIEQINSATSNMFEERSCERAVFPELPVPIFEDCSRISANARNCPAKARCIQWSETILLSLPSLRI